MVELVFLTFVSVVILVFAVFEKNKLDRNLKRIPNRILVNGIRGKSTVTRLIMGIIKEDGQRVAGKTTGTSPRLFYWDQDKEEDIVRSLQGANISEQKMIVNKVARRNVDTLVTECMAVNPEYQKVFQERFVKATITIITNVMEDHLDVMGPTVDQIAQAFSHTIPHHGFLVIPPNTYEKYFKQIAEKRGTKVIIADPADIEEEYLTAFPYMMFAENAAFGLAVADILGIEKDVALRGMLLAPVDPGAMRIFQFGEEEAPDYFFNGFAANDPTSTINIWNKIGELNYSADNSVIIMNCRDDRLDRTIQFAEEVLPKLNADKLILTGKGISPIVQAFDERKLPVHELINLEKHSTDQVMDAIHQLPGSNLIYGIGNIHGGGQEIVDAIELLNSGNNMAEIPENREKQYKIKSRQKENVLI